MQEWVFQVQVVIEIVELIGIHFVKLGVMLEYASWVDCCSTFNKKVKEILHQ